MLNSLMNKPSTRYGLAVIMTYEGMRKYKASLCSIAWTAVCLDEGQKIKNPHSDITATCKMLPAFHRIILSGTPIQNSLVELWSLFDFVYPGRLGSLPVFELEFATPIRLGGYARADKFAYELAIRCAKTLQSIVRPYLLRRKKDDLMAVTKLPPKTEQVLFCQISPKQREIYLNILSSSEVKAVIERRMVAFRAISVLRKLCNHPSLVLHDGTLDRKVLITPEDDDGNGNGNGKNGGHGAIDEEDGEDADEDDFCFVNKTGGRGIVWGESGKLLVLSKLLPLWHLEGHKVLVFCQTRGKQPYVIACMYICFGAPCGPGYDYLHLSSVTCLSSSSSVCLSLPSVPLSVCRHVGYHRVHGSGAGIPIRAVRWEHSGRQEGRHRAQVQLGREHIRDAADDPHGWGWYFLDCGEQGYPL